MGDRTDCYLTLKTPASSELVKLIDEMMSIDDHHEDHEFYFEEVNYAQLEPELEDYLRTNGIPYTWSWHAGGGYGPGVEIFDGQEKETFNCDHDGEIVLTLAEALDPEKVQQAIRWDNIRKEIQES